MTGGSVAIFLALADDHQHIGGSCQQFRQTQGHDLLRPPEHPFAAGPVIVWEVFAGSAHNAHVEPALSVFVDVLRRRRPRRWCRALAVRILGLASWSGKPAPKKSAVQPQQLWMAITTLNRRLLGG